MLHKAQILKMLYLDGALWLKCILPLNLLYFLVYVSILEHPLLQIVAIYKGKKAMHFLPSVDF